MRSLVVYILLLIPFMLPAQDITGVWTGFVNTSEKHLPYEVIISENKGKLTGYSHITFYVSGVEMIAVKTLKVTSEDGKILLRDDDLIYNNFRESQPKKLKQSSTLSLTIEDTAMVLSGPFETNDTKNLRPAFGDIVLQKRTNRPDSKLFAKLDQMKLLTSLSFLNPNAVPYDIAINKPAIKRSETVTMETVIADVTEKKMETIIEPGIKSIDIAMIISKPLEPPPLEVKEKKVTIMGSTRPNREALVLQPVLKQSRIITPPIVQPTVPVTTSTAAIKKPVPVQPKEDKTVAINKLVTPTKPAAVPVTQPIKPVTITQPVVKRPADIVPIGSAVDIAKRKIETIENVSFKTDSLVLSLYDNGEVDGDTVSVLMNGKIIIGKQGLTTNAVTKTIYITPDMGDSLQLIMYAENLGSLPPNTGLLIIQDGNERHEIRFAGDLQKNAAIVLRRRR